MLSENSDITEDKLLGGKVIIFQPKKGYRVAVDSCLLAAAVPAKPENTILDLGVGTGAVSLCIEARVPKCRITGIDKNTGYLELAQKSVARNDWEKYIDLHFGDVRHPPKVLEPASFDFVVANPPYFEEGSYFKSPDKGKSEAHAAHGSTLQDWVNCAKAFLKTNGQFFVIFPADSGKTLLEVLGVAFSQIRVCRVFSNEKNPPIRIIAAASQGNMAETTVIEAQKLIIRDEKGNYTPESRSILWDGAVLSLNDQSSLS